VYAIPPTVHEGRPLVTGVSCPDCRGVLQVQTEGRASTLVFECRIGHTFDVAELLAAEEECLEEHLWAANTIFEELIALLKDLAAHASRHDEPAALVRVLLERAERAGGNALTLRALIQDNRPIDLAPADPAQHLGGDPGAEGIEPEGDPSGG
jgi:hypothetical protein